MPDIFISYAHRDNEFPRYEPRGWIDCFYDALKARLAGIRGRGAGTSIWLDKSEGRITGTSLLTETIKGDLAETKILLTVLSPAYEASRWCADELRFFNEAVAVQGGMSHKRRSRVVKVFKLPIPPNERSGLAVHDISDAPGYEFFSRGRNGKPLEYDPPFGNDLGRDFSREVSSLAYDLAELLDSLDDIAPVLGSGVAERPAAPSLRTVTASGSGSGVTVYLAETTYDVRAQRERMRSELQQFGHSVVPASDIPPGPGYAQAVRAELARARVSIHIVGESYGVIPERANESIVEIQYRQAGEEAAQRPELVRFPWIAGGHDAEPRLRVFLDSLQDDPRLLGGSLEDLKSRVAAELARRPVADAPARSDVKNVYLIFDPPDRDAAKPLDDWLFAQGFEVLKPIAKGSPGELRQLHRNNLKRSDGVLIYYGQETEAWLETKLNDLESVYAHGRGRRRPLIARGVVLADPQTPEKQEFRRHSVRVIPGFGGFQAELLRHFVADLNGSEATTA